MTAPTVLRSDTSNVFLVKFWFPLLSLGGAFGVFWEDLPSWRFLLVSPFMIAAFFGASVATLELRGGVLRYRRFFGWTTILENEIVSSGVAWSPIIGYIRLNRPVFLWGRIYFVLDANLNANPFRRGEYSLLRYLKKEPIALEPVSPPNSSKLASHSMKLKLLAAAATGVLISCLTQIAIPHTEFRSVLQRPFDPHQPAFITVPERIFHLINSFPVLLVLFVVFSFLAVFRRHRKNAWIFAFLAGVSVPFIYLRWI